MEDKGDVLGKVGMLALTGSVGVVDSQLSSLT